MTLETLSKSHRCGPDAPERGSLLSHTSLFGCVQRHNLKFNVELIRKQQHIAVEGEDDISKEKLEAVTAEVHTRSAAGCASVIQTKHV